MRVKLTFKFKEGEDAVNHRPMIRYLETPAFEEHDRTEKLAALDWVQNQCRRFGLSEKDLISHKKVPFELSRNRRSNSPKKPKESC